MIQTSVAVPVHARPQPERQESELLDPLLRLAGEVRNAHALIVAGHGLDLMCGLIRHGCLAATVLRIGAKPDAGDYDLILVPHVNGLPSPNDLIRFARHSLAPNGRLVARVRDGRAAAALSRRLRLNGFSAMRSTHLPGLILLRADLRRVS